MFLVRRINKSANIGLFCEVECGLNMSAYAPTQEIRPSADGGLSTWEVNSLADNDIKEAVLAIVTTSNELKTFDVIVIDNDMLDKYHLHAKQTDPGKEVPYIPMQDYHFDILGVTVKKFVRCVGLYRDIIASDKERVKFIRRISEGKIKQYLTDAKNNNQLKLDKINKAIKKSMKWI